MPGREDEQPETDAIPGENLEIVGTHVANQGAHGECLTHDAIEPMPITARSSNAKECRALNSSKAVAANMVGIARKKENSVAAGRDKPRSKPPMMVAPEREVPGIMDKACAKPIQVASAGRISSTAGTCGVRLRLSIHRIKKPPRMNAV